MRCGSTRSPSCAIWRERLGDRADAADYAALRRRDRARASSGAFWFEAGGYLYDVIDGPEGAVGRHRPTRATPACAPIRSSRCLCRIALLDADERKRVLDDLRAELLTPVGLRSLAPSDPRYVGRYGGGPRERDGAYHQGTVWSWLLGPFVTRALPTFTATRAAAPATACSAIPATCARPASAQSAKSWMAMRPFEPRGCFAQAWGVAEILRAWSDIMSANTTPDGMQSRNTPRAATAPLGAASMNAERRRWQNARQRPRPGRNGARI